MKVIIYEDAGYQNLYPLSLLRGVFDIRCGANTIKERIDKILNHKFEIILYCRSGLTDYLKEVHANKVNETSKDDLLLINGRVIFTEESLKHLISASYKNHCYIYEDEIIGAYITKDKYKYFENAIEKISENSIFDEQFFDKLNLKEKKLSDEFGICLINYPWDLINYIKHEGLSKDIEYFLKRNKNFYNLNKTELHINSAKIFISTNLKIPQGIILDASEGSIVIDQNVTIEPFTYVKGPVFIGKNCLLKSGTRIYGPSVIGEYSKIAGEVGESVFHSFVNKQHDGFIGHSYICPFVNLGADTVTSDLKNNYSKIRVKLNGYEIDTSMQFLGSIVGDHSKTSINTMLNTGSLIGIFSNIFGGGFPNKDIKSFSWNESGKPSTHYNIDKAIETAGIVMERRGVKMSESYIRLVNSYYEYFSVTQSSTSFGLHK